MREIFRRGTLVVWAGIDQHGRLAIEGQDLGGHPATSEYEYFIWIAPEHWPLVRRALGGQEYDDVVELIAANAERLVTAGERSWLQAHDIPLEFDCRIGE